jgi:2-dehydropantoate 2-reductase
MTAFLGLKLLVSASPRHDKHRKMRTLIVGIGALGGTIAARANCAGIPFLLAARSTESAAALRASGLQVSGIGGTATARTIQVATIGEYSQSEKFDLILLATKAHDALEIAPSLTRLLAPDGVLLPIQNGGVAQMLAERLGSGRVIGGLSNLGATMVEPGVYQQRNAGYLLIGELAGGPSARVERIAQALKGAIDVRTTANLRGAIWAKLLLNCSVTTIGAIAGQTMRQYMILPDGREVFRRAYDEALAVTLGTGTQPERMIVDPVPPGRKKHSTTGKDYDGWIDQILGVYGDLKPSMLQDFERGRRTEIDFINGYVAQLGADNALPVSMNAAITQMVHSIESGAVHPNPARLVELIGKGG